MNALRFKHLGRCCSQWLTVGRHLSSQRQNTEASRAVLEPLVQRQLVRVSGSDVISFLQGLTTNDMKMLESPSVPCVYTMFLNKAGRVMYDAIVYRANDPSTVLIECDKDISNELRRHLKIYLVRRKIQIDDVADEIKPWVLFTKNGEDSTIPNVKSVGDVKVFTDPRLSDLGYRLLAPSALTNSDLSTLFIDGDKFVAASASDDLSYRDHRYGLGVAEGVMDLLPGKQFPLEANCDILNGVSFNKGCYIGQELTARVHHTGVIRKRHMPIQLSETLPNDSTKIVRTKDGTKVGTVLGNTAKRAVCLLRVEKVLKCKEMFIDGKTCYTEKPLWWPPEVLSNVSKQNAV